MAGTSVRQHPLTLLVIRRVRRGLLQNVTKDLLTSGSIFHAPGPVLSALQALIQFIHSTA